MKNVNLSQRVKHMRLIIQSMRSEKRQIQLIFGVFLLGLALMIAGSLAWNINKEYKLAKDYAQIEGEASYNKDLLYRRWASKHGGVYVPVTNETQPNPNLTHIVDRDVVAKGTDKELTLINPAYMTRQVFTIAKEQYGVKGHITSLKPIRPENKADEWENIALNKFEQGSTFHSSIEEIDGAEYLRFMHAMYVENSCLKCHADQGYRLGDVRGGISVSVPMVKYNNVANTKVKDLAVVHFSLFFILLIFSVLGYKKNLKSLQQRIQAQKGIIESKEQLKFQNDEILSLNEEYKSQNEELQKAKDETEEKKQNLLIKTLEAEAVNKELMQSNKNLSRAKERVEKNEMLLNITGEIAAVGGWEINLNTQELTWTKEVYRIHEVDENFEPTVEHAIDFYDEESKPTIQSAVSNAIDKGEPFDVELGIITAKGTHKFIKAIGKVRSNNDNSAKFVFGTFQDITTNKILHNELVRSKERAEESERLKTAFLNNMSHEIRTPMNGIIGFSEMLSITNKSEEKKAEYINIIQKSSRQLLNVVDDILDIAKIEAGQVKINDKETDLHKFCTDIINSHKLGAIKKNINLINCEQKCNHSKVKVDLHKLTQVVNNLVSNAIKFTEQGTVQLKCCVKKNEIEFSVSDTGIGIDEKLHKKIFDRFRQAELNTTRNYGGTGLGLSIAKGLVENMNGRIWVDSQLGKGSVFYFTIPYKPVNEQKEQIFTTKSEELNDYSMFTILLAEDELVNYLYISEVLSDMNIEIVHVQNGLDAVKYIQSGKVPDLILMDIKMPIMNGYEATKKIKMINADIPIVVITAHAFIEDREKAINAGCDDYLSKPVNAKSLLSCIDKQLPKKEKA